MSQHILRSAILTAALTCGADLRGWRPGSNPGLDRRLVGHLPC
jgi:hypothetical protein